ncbi:hypothetical protein AB7W70_20000, partial [Providencia rettgeri]
GCNPAYSKSIHTWLRFGEIMRGSLSTESTMTNIGLNNITQEKDWNVINDGRNEYSYNWINEEKQLRMLTIKYI